LRAAAIAANHHQPPPHLLLLIDDADERRHGLAGAESLDEFQNRVTVANTLVRPETGQRQLVARKYLGGVDRLAALAVGSRGTAFDACAAVGHVPVDFHSLDADLCSVTAHKLGGPKGAAALLVRRGLRLDPLLVGGAQERARRAGIEDVPAWVGFGAACAAIDVAGEAAAQRALIATASRVVDEVPGVMRFGASGDDALPNVLCVWVDGVEAEPILLALDQHGVAVHSGSSCSSETLEPSPVLAAMGVDADHSLRVSVGWSSQPADVERFVEVFPGIVERLRGLRG